MKRLNITERVEVDYERFKVEKPQERDFGHMVDEPTAIYENDQLLIVYDVPTHIPKQIEQLRRALRTIRYERNYRSAGLMSNCRTFGYSPRNAVRNDVCRSSSLARQFPSEHKILCDFAGVIGSVYESWNPALYAQHADTTQQNVIDDYHMDGHVFTSGIVNKTSALGYHFDTGNFQDVWSNMIVLKKDIAGGYLSVPELGLGFELVDGSMLMFDGQSLLHGVTPIKKLKTTAYRYSVVYYSLRRMWNCLPITDEIIRIRQKQTERTRKRTRTDLKPEDFKS